MSRFAIRPTPASLVVLALLLAPSLSAWAAGARTMLPVVVQFERPTGESTPPGGAAAAGPERFGALPESYPWVRLAKALVPAVVNVRTEHAQRGIRGLGSGFVIKVDVTGLPTIPLGSSAALEVAEPVMVNAAYQRLRARRARPAEVSLEPLLPAFDDQGRLVGPVVDWSAQLEDPAVAAEVRTALERGFARLPEDYRVVVVLRDVEGLSNEDVAALLGLSLSAVKSRLHRARLALRQFLSELWTSPGREARPSASPLAS